MPIELLYPEKTSPIAMKKTILIFVWGLLTGTVSAAVFDYPIDTINGKAVYRYPVERSIGLYRISVNFGVSQDAILDLNPQLRQRGLRYDDVILIPVTATDKPAKEAAKPEEVQEPEKAQPKEEAHPLLDIAALFAGSAAATAVYDSAAITADEPAERIVPDEPIDSDAVRIAYLLPLHADAITRTATMNRFYDFYAGSLIALYEAGQEGRKIHAWFYDSEKSDVRVREVLQDSLMNTMDVVIGPTYLKQVLAANEWGRDKDIPVIIPFTDSVPGIEQNPNIRQFNPTHDDKARAIAQEIAQDPEARCILINSAANDIPASIQAIHRALNARGIHCAAINLRDLLNDSIADVLSESHENIFVFNTERYSNLQLVLPHLTRLTGQYPIRLLSQYSWQKEDIPLPQLYASIFSADSVSKDRYNELFDTYFHHTRTGDSPSYDLLGYDITRYALQLTGRQDSLSEIFHGLQSDISFRRIESNGGYQNQSIQVIKK